jgi:hypothetical protein
LLVISIGLLLLSGCQILNNNSGSGGGVTLTNASLNFGTVPVGTSKSLQDTLTNNSTSSVTINSVTGSSSSLQVIGFAQPQVVAAGQSATFKVQYQPSATGNLSQTISFVGSNSQVLASISATGSASNGGVFTLNPTQLTFGSVAVGSNQKSTVTISNTGTSDLSINQATLSGAGFTMSNMALPMTLHAGNSTSATLTFAPTSAGSFSGTVAFTTTGAQGNVSLPLSGTGTSGGTPGSLTANPTSLAFSNVQVGSTSSKSETVTNTGGTTVTISQANVSGTGYSVSGLTLPTTLAANQSVTFTVKFAPSSAGTVNGSLSVVSDASNSPLGVTLSGTGTTPGQLSLSPATLNFGSVTVGSSAALNGTLSASGASVTISSASANSNEFVLSGITLPATITAGQSAAFTVTFAPQASGTATGSLTFTSNATNPPTTESLTGSGTAPTHSVSLSWNASSGAVGYNVYRGGVSGGPYTIINPSLDASTSYTDTTVSAGTTYYYVVTAVNSSSVESGYSNQATAAVPSP